MRAGRHKEGRAAYIAGVHLAEAGLEVDPSDTTALSTLAMLAAKIGDLPRARQKITEARQIAPDDVNVLARAAAIHHIEGRSDAAMTPLERAVSLGYSRTLIVETDDFPGLASSPRFKAIIAPQPKM